MGIENPVHLLFIAVVALVVLGPRRLPELARTLGKGLREFRAAVDGAAAAPDHQPETDPLSQPGALAAPPAVARPASGADPPASDAPGASAVQGPEPSPPSPAEPAGG